MNNMNVRRIVNMYKRQVYVRFDTNDFTYIRKEDLTEEELKRKVITYDKYVDNDEVFIDIMTTD